jgi:hypothetical protein
MSFFSSAEIGETGRERYAILVAGGINWSRKLRRLPASSLERKVIPVTLPPGPPGRLRLVTRPYLTGSNATSKTIGIVEVASFAATALYGEPVVTITSTLSSTSSAARCDIEIVLLAQRYSIVTF